MDAMDYPAQNAGKGGAAVVPVIPLEKLTLELPFCGTVPAGFPSPADDYLEERLSLDKYIIKNLSSPFFLKVEGLSMKASGERNRGGKQQGSGGEVAPGRRVAASWFREGSFRQGGAGSWQAASRSQEPVSSKTVQAPRA
ncbi:MAG: hypothetical protein H6559_34960 [Lewinellaceae bacterium]|nr:hypothetical protein [Lewinellaceae bacterium]